MVIPNLARSCNKSRQCKWHSLDRHHVQRQRTTRPGSLLLAKSLLHTRGLYPFGCVIAMRAVVDWIDVTRAQLGAMEAGPDIACHYFDAPLFPFHHGNKY